MDLFGGFLIEAAAASSGGLIGMIVPFVIMMAFFYIIIFIPEKKRKKKYGTMLDNLKVNDEVITKGGILGKIVNIKDTFIVLETGPDRMRIKLDKNGILNVLSSKSEEIEEKNSKTKEDKTEKNKNEDDKEVGYKEN